VDRVPVDTGRAPAHATIADEQLFARDLAGFVRELWAIDTDGRHWGGGQRGGPLSSRDGDVRRGLTASVGLTETSRLADVWSRCLAVPAPLPRDDVWIHADLMPGNLLVRDGRLCAVIDLGMLCVGDPAVDLMPAWNLLGPRARDVYRNELGVDDSTWERGRGWAVVQGIVALPYYVESNPVMAETARHTLRAVLD